MANGGGPANDAPIYAAKIYWAEKHLQTLKWMVTRYVNEEIDGIRCQIGPQEPNGMRFRLSGEGSATNVLDMGLVAGDAIHNMRAGLDHIAWQLVEASGDTPNEATHFPLLKVGPTPDRYGGAKAPSIPGGPNIPAAAVEVIRRVQPYEQAHPVTEDSLWWLHRLDVADKHHALLLTVGHVMAGQTAVYSRLSPGEVVSGQLRTQRMLEDGAEFVFVPDEATVNVKCQTLLNVCLPQGRGDAPQPLPVVSTLREIFTRVSRVMNELKPFC